MLVGYRRPDLHAFITDASTCFILVCEEVRIAAIIASKGLQYPNTKTLFLVLNLQRQKLSLLCYLAICQQRFKADLLE